MFRRFSDVSSENINELYMALGCFISFKVFFDLTLRPSTVLTLKWQRGSQSNDVQLFRSRFGDVVILTIEFIAVVKQM